MTRYVDLDKLPLVNIIAQTYIQLQRTVKKYGGDGWMRRRENGNLEKRHGKSRRRMKRTSAGT